MPTSCAESSRSSVCACFDSEAVPPTEGSRIRGIPTGAPLPSGCRIPARNGSLRTELTGRSSRADTSQSPPPPQRELRRLLKLAQLKDFYVFGFVPLPRFTFRSSGSPTPLAGKLLHCGGTDSKCRRILGSGFWRCCTGVPPHRFASSPTPLAGEGSLALVAGGGLHGEDSFAVPQPANTMQQLPEGRGLALAVGETPERSLR
jgi:hypothetical protein